MPSISARLKEMLLPEKSVDGSPVYLQENGERLGTITREENGYYILDCRGVEMRFSSEDLIEGSGGYIYRPPWYSKAKDLLASLEARRASDPELFESTTYIDLDDQLRHLAERGTETVSFLSKKRASIDKQVDELEIQIDTLSQTEPASIGRREYARRVVDLNRKLKILEINRSRIDDLISKFMRIPFIDVKTIENKAVDPVKKDDEPEPRRAEGERIKKIRILKLEKNLAEKQLQVAEGYIKDRLRQINNDIDELKALAKENKDNEKVLTFLRNKLADLNEEKKELQDKLGNVKHVSVEDVEKPDLPEVVESPEEEIRSGLDMSLIARIGSVVFILGLVIVLVMSLFGVI